MVIGVTESGDAGLDFSWLDRIGKVDGAVLITKALNGGFIRQVLPWREKVIVHATCTGYGGTLLEPGVPPYEAQLEQVRRLIAAGFPREQVVVRVDPIIPTPKGLGRAEMVVDDICGEVGRFRISVLDMYPHVRRRFKAAGLPLPYGERFHADAAQFQMVDGWLAAQAGKGTFECCAEPRLKNCEQAGCVSPKDLALLGLEPGREYGGGFQRRDCLCLGCKRQLLRQKGRCSHGCIYCFWKDE